MKPASPMTSVVNISTQGRAYDVYIGRPSSFGNPYVMGRDGTREQVISKYETLVRSNLDFIQRIKTELRGKRLGCYCSPLPCHGDVLARIADE